MSDSGWPGSAGGGWGMGGFRLGGGPQHSRVSAGLGPGVPGRARHDATRRARDGVAQVTGKDADQVFPLTGNPDVGMFRLQKAGTRCWQVWRLALVGIGRAKMLDTGWNGLVCKAEQMFVLRPSTRDNQRGAAQATHDESVWDHLCGAVSGPFAADAGADIALENPGDALMRSRDFGGEWARAFPGRVEGAGGMQFLTRRKSGGPRRVGYSFRLRASVGERHCPGAARRGTGRGGRRLVASPSPCAPCPRLLPPW